MQTEINSYKIKFHTNGKKYNKANNIIEMYFHALKFAAGWFQLKVAYDSSVTHLPKTPIRGHTPVRQTD